MKRHTILFLLISVALVSCEKEIEFNGEQVEPKLVISCFACADSVVRADITASRFFLDGGETFVSVTNATVAVYVNGVFVENMQHISGAKYIGTCKPGAGDELRLVVTAPNFDKAEAKDVFPRKANFLSIDSTITAGDSSVISYPVEYYTHNGQSDIVYDTTGWEYTVNYEYKIRFKDPPGERNYYRLVVFETMVYPWMSEQDYIYNRNFLNGFDDLIFQSGKESSMNEMFEEGTSNAYNIFSDDLIEGESYTITIPYRYHKYVYKDAVSQNNESRMLTFELQTISESYYLYLKSLNDQNNATEFFSEPVQIFTNVEKGLGLLGTRTKQPIGNFILSY